MRSHRGSFRVFLFQERTRPFFFQKKKVELKALNFVNYLFYTNFFAKNIVYLWIPLTPKEHYLFVEEAQFFKFDLWAGKRFIYAHLYAAFCANEEQARRASQKTQKNWQQKTRKSFGREDWGCDSKWHNNLTRDGAKNREYLSQ